MTLVTPCQHGIGLRRIQNTFCLDRVPGDAPDKKASSKKGVEKEGAPGHAQCVPGGVLLEGVHFGTLVWDLFRHMFEAATWSGMKLGNLM